MLAGNRIRELVGARDDPAPVPLLQGDDEAALLSVLSATLTATADDIGERVAELAGPGTTRSSRWRTFGGSVDSWHTSLDSRNPQLAPFSPRPAVVDVSAHSRARNILRTGEVLVVAYPITTSIVGGWPSSGRLMTDCGSNPRA